MLVNAKVLFKTKSLIKYYGKKSNNNEKMIYYVNTHYISIQK